MILQALTNYYNRKCNDPDPAQRLPLFGLEQKEIPFLIEINLEGELLQIRDTRDWVGKKKIARSYRVPIGAKKTSGVAANLLWDTMEYVLGIDTKGKPERVKAQHQAFLARIRALPEAVRDGVGLVAVCRFLTQLNIDQLKLQPVWAELFESNAVVSFILQGDQDLICQRPAVIGAAQNVAIESNTPQAMCLVTGNFGPVERLHASIKGVWGAQTSGANIVSFNARAFESYGKSERQGENAPVSQVASFAYTTALNHLLSRGSQQRIQVGDASTVFWAEEGTEFETTIADIFGESPKDDPDRGARSVTALLSAMSSGKWGDADKKTQFHVLGLSPNAARISIRFYHCAPLEKLGKAIAQYFEDLALVRGPNDPQYPSIFRLLSAIAVQNKADNIPPKLGGAILDSIFAGSITPYPSLWLNAAVGRCRAEQNVNYLRAASIKACLNRLNRSASLSPSNRDVEQEFLPMLDLSNPNPAYRLGRLFATLEKIQEEASPGINATIRDRYYGAASSTPVAVFTTLLRLKNAHLKKLSPGNSVRFEKLLGEILNPVTDFPKNMSLQDQGRFAIGYYHQRQDFFTKKTEAINLPITAAQGTPA